jgi:hypothetical protein
LVTVVGRLRYSWVRKLPAGPAAPNRIGQSGPMVDYIRTIDRWDDATGENLIEQPSPVPVFFGLALRFHPLKDLLAVSLERAKALVQGVLNRFSPCCGVAS